MKSSLKHSAYDDEAPNFLGDTRKPRDASLDNSSRGLKADIASRKRPDKYRMTPGNE